ncbi:hypothetical protein [Succinimonas amylolytica]|uniref:hypothetical protein n=1 Tax=Succinimonas amylolytica TaxID=83769 RepID=UPI0012FA4CCB|nr:hypothetical protein [Succinimonas amylolytica]
MTVLRKSLFLALLSGVAATGVAMAQFLDDFRDPPECGQHHEYWDKSLSSDIKSETIVHFEYNSFPGPGFIVPEVSLEARPDSESEPFPNFYVLFDRTPSGAVRVVARGGNNTGHRDGSRFVVRYEISDDGLPRELQTIVRKHNLSRDNGHVSHTDGLPTGDGSILSVRYDSGEAIYRGNNVFPLLDDAATREIYQAFRRAARRQGYDFTTAGSSEPVYDDPTVEMLQGIWKGKHFGRECVAEITGQHIRIFYDGELADDTDYVIFEGMVKPNRLAKNSSPDDKYPRYDNFRAFTSISKKNGFTIVGHVFRNGSSSSVELFRQDNR